ncbi:MAG: efflux transporter periplasmic adaptor subunit, partial [Lamprocystis purpurea]|nr:efflux transporter periplasmic adaptor subunit [Lamprocystis purpurea]
VLIVAADQKAQLRRIQTGPSVGADVVVRAGLSAGELVITEGLQKVRPGILVTAAPAQSATQAPAGLVAP